MTRPRITSTPIGASALAAAVVTILMYVLSLWHPWGHVPGQVKTAVQTILTVAVVYGAGYLSVVRSPGQKVGLELTASHLPTVQRAQAEPPGTV